VSALFFAHSESKLRSAIRSLEQARELHVESLLPCLETALRARLILLFIVQDRVNDFREESAQLARVGRLAASSPTLVPLSPLRYQAQATSLLADISFLHLADGLSAERLGRVEDCLSRLYREGEPWKEERAAALEQALKMLTCRPTEGMLTTWKTPQDPQGTRYQTRKELLARHARRLLAEWQLHEPDNPTTFLWLASVENWLGNHELALLVARKAVALHLNADQSAWLKRIEDEARTPPAPKKAP
jgi:hypothetical protein